MTTSQPSKALHLGLWITQGLLAAIFLMAGANKLFQSIPELAKMLPWVTETPEVLVRFIGLSEVLGALGLILPSALRIKPVLTPLAGLGLALVMIFAALFHFNRGETANIGANFAFVALALFVSWGRYSKAPIASKAS